MSVRIEVHGKVKTKYAVEFRCSSCSCEFWVDADSLGELPANYCDLKYNCPECGSSSYPVDIMKNSYIFNEHNKWKPVFWQIIESPFHRHFRICNKEK